MRTTHFATHGEEVFVTSGDRLEVLVFPMTGGQPTVIGREANLLPFTREDLLETFAGHPLERLVTPSAVAWWPDDRRRAAVVSLLVDDLGYVWLEENRLDLDAPGTWSVFHRSGAYVASVVMPARYRAFDVRGNVVYGVWRDEFDVEYVQARSLNRGNVR